MQFRRQPFGGSAPSTAIQTDGWQAYDRRRVHRGTAHVSVGMMMTLA